MSRGDLMKCKTRQSEKIFLHYVKSEKSQWPSLAGWLWLAQSDSLWFMTRDDLRTWEMFSFDCSHEALWCLPQKRLRQKFDKFNFLNNFAPTSYTKPQEHTFPKLTGELLMLARECKSDSFIFLGQSFACFAPVCPNWAAPLEYKYQGASLYGKYFCSMVDMVDTVNSHWKVDSVEQERKYRLKKKENQC